MFLEETLLSSCNIDSGDNRTEKFLAEEPSPGQPCIQQTRP